MVDSGRKRRAPQGVQQQKDKRRKRSRQCGAEKCTKRPSYGEAGTKCRIYCAKHGVSLTPAAHSRRVPPARLPPPHIARPRHKAFRCMWFYHWDLRIGKVVF